MAELALEALFNGCHVFVEKPLATSVEDCDKIAFAAKQGGRSVCVGHSLLRDPFVARALRLVRSGAIGEPLTVDYFRSSAYPPYVGGPLPVVYRDGGYPFRDLGIHGLYLVEAILGEIKEVSDCFSSSGRHPHLHFDEWRVVLRCQRGTGQIQLSWNVRPQQSLLLVQGTRGVVRADLFGMSTTAKRSGRLPEHVSRTLNAVREGTQVATQALANTLRFLGGRLRQYHGLQALVADFYQCLHAGRAAPVTPERARSVSGWTEVVARRGDAAKSRFLDRFASPLANPVLVTGANGFIGRHLVARLLRENQRLRLFVRRAPPPELLHDPRVEIVLGDLGDRDAVARAVAGVHTIYHLGAAMRGSGQDFDCGTVAGTRNIVDTALENRVAKLIYMSSLTVLHATFSTGDRTISENWPLEPHPQLRGHYSRTKLAAEQYVTEAVQVRGLPAIILRPAEVIGPGAPFITSGIAQRRNGRLIILGDGKLHVPMVYIDDLMDAIRLAEQKSPFDGSIIHIVDPASLTQNDLVRQYLALSDEHLRVTPHTPSGALFPGMFDSIDGEGVTPRPLLCRCTDFARHWRLVCSTPARRRNCWAGGRVLVSRLACPKHWHPTNIRHSKRPRVSNRHSRESRDTVVLMNTTVANRHHFDQGDNQKRGVLMTNVETVTTATFWFCLTLVLYTYVGYPALIWCCARLFGRKSTAHDITDPDLPSVSVLIAVYNEESVIRARLEDALGLDYPRKKLDIVIGSDGSTDATRDIVERYADRGVRLLDYPERRGKATVLNSAMAELNGEIVLFSDANTFIDKTGGAEACSLVQRSAGWCSVRPTCARRP